MKKNERNALAGLSVQELQMKADQWRGELFSIRLQMATKPIQDKHAMSKLRKNIARALTALRQKHAEQ